MSFFSMPLAQDLACKDFMLRYGYHRCYKLGMWICTVAPGQSLYILDVCPEDRDESNGHSIVKLWLQFIPIFGALHSQLRKGHTTKKDIPMFLICITSS